MSNPGQSPSVKRTRFTPQSADPVNPTNGDFFYSDGTSRIAGPWVYQAGSWQQVQTSGALSTVNDLTFIPQATTPTAAAGKVFYSDGTSRAAGLWIYNGSQWVQISGATRYAEFAVKDYYQVRLASTGTNIPLTNIFANGSNALDGVVMLNNDLVLIKDQAVPSQNGVYKVGLSGPPTRATGATTFSDLNKFSAIVNLGTVNKDSSWFQGAVLTSLSDSQVWTAEPGTQTFTVPADITAITVTGCGGGGAGGGGGGVPATGSFSHGGGGGGGGAGASIVTVVMSVTPGETISVALGDGGKRAVGQASSGTFAPNGGGGTNTTVMALSGTLRFPGASGGFGGQCGTTAGGNGAGKEGGTGNATSVAGNNTAEGGIGGNGSSSGVSLAGAAGQDNTANTGGAGGGITGSRGGSGGGGGGAISVGAIGGVGAVIAYTPSTPVTAQAGVDASKGAGGGGAGGAGANAGGGSRIGATSGAGGPGYVRFSW